MYKNYYKRIIDVILSLGMALLLSWLIVIILLVYMLTLNFPVLFVQSRIGRRNQPFLMHKFRTLLPGEMAVDKRRFWLGDALRFLSLDELPQLWNVIIGDMSLVGPRPLPAEYLPLYSERQRKRHDVRPGITGLAQVNGRHSLSWQQKFDFDLDYVNRCSFLLDCQILFQTFLLLLSFKPDVSLKEEPFKGNS